GVLLILGLMTRPAALVNAVTTFVAAFIYHKAQVGGPALLGTVFFAATTSLLLTGPGRFSIDYLFAKRKAAPPRRAEPAAAADGGGM
ncbi:MAG: DoxX family membrane protein, partial [Gemmataceae bacterium]|nr:DoxX family membrane protein [Gemmataceae bacterium]